MSNTRALEEELTVAKYVQISAMVMLVYDHVLTLDQEVDRIWNHKFSGPALLFLINRYGNVLQSIVTAVGYNHPKWTKSACAHVATFEGSSSVALIAICELVMMLRVYALYDRSLRILVLLMALWTIQVTVSSIGISTGFALQLPPGAVGCILIGDSPLFSALWVSPVITNSVIFLLTLNRSRRYWRDSGTAPTLHLFVRDGAMHFLVIFTANSLNTILFIVGQENFRVESQLLTSIMISRLVLNLRSVDDTTMHGDLARPTSAIKFVTGAVGNVELNPFFDASPTSLHRPHMYVDDIPHP